jgi:N-acetylneuraminate synthase
MINNLNVWKVEKKWGYEIWFANNDGYCGKEIVCENKIWSSEGDYHYHPKKDETFWVIHGELLLDVEGTRHLLHKGCGFRIKPGTKHRFRSVYSVCRFIEASTTHFDDDSIRCKLEE